MVELTLQVDSLTEELITVLLTHVAHSPHPASDELSFRHFDGQPQVRNTDVSCRMTAVN